jgi:hypothetical protein
MTTTTRAARPKLNWPSREHWEQMQAGCGMGPTAPYGTANYANEAEHKAAMQDICQLRRQLYRAGRLEDRRAVRLLIEWLKDEYGELPELGSVLYELPPSVTLILTRYEATEVLLDRVYGAATSDEAWEAELRRREALERRVEVDR